MSYPFFMMSAMAQSGDAPPPVPVSDPDWPSVSALLHFDGADGSTDIIDETGREWVAEGAAKISTGWGAFGGASLYLGGAIGTRVYTLAADSISPGSAEYSLEMRVRPGALPTATNLTAIVSTRNATTTGFALYVNSSGYLRLLCYTGSATPAVDMTAMAGALSVGVASTIQISRSGTTWRLFVDGVVVATATSAANIISTQRMHIGWDGTGNAQRHYTGYVDEFRITSGVARDTTNYTPAASEFWYPARALQGAYTWFNDCRAIKLADGRILVGAVAWDGRVRASWLDSGGAWQHFELLPASGVDDHNNPAFTTRDDGMIVATYSRHNNAERYISVGTVAGDPSSFGSQLGLDSQLGAGPYSYANPVQTGESGNPLYDFFRSGTAPTWSAYFSQSGDGGSTWGTASRLLNGGSDGRPYVKLVQNGSTRIDFACTDGHPGAEATNRIRHFYFDNGLWFDSSGSSLGSPPFDTTSDLSTVYGGPTDIAWVWDIQIGSDGHPRIAFATFPSTTDHRYHYARWTGTAWSATEICTGGSYLYSGEPYYSGGLCLDPDDPDVVYASRESDGEWHLYKYVTSDGGSTFAETLLRDDANFYRPYAVKDSDKLVVMTGRYTSFSDFETRIMLLDK